MEIPGYSIDIEPVIQQIKDKNYSRIALQVPEGLKQAALKIVDVIKKTTKNDVFILADPCYGACDRVQSKIQHLDIACILHIGHLELEKLQSPSIPTFYINAQSTLDVSKIVKKALPQLIGKKIGIVTTAQHLHTLPQVKTLLRENHFEPVIGKGDARIAHEGQILGCNFTTGKSIAATVDSYLFIGSGTFHPIGLMLSTKKPVIAVDPYTFTVVKDELETLKETIMRQRYGAIASSQHAQRFGILIATKSGQQRLQQAFSIRKLLTAHKRHSYFILLDTFSPDSLLSFRDIDCYVSTGCPRIALDDYMQYKKPIITPIELEIVLGVTSWDAYHFDEIVPQSKV
jgi:2-(3-amino-3-carboxypropyl)histidine synthase